jgi:conserved repeat domain
MKKFLMFVLILSAALSVFAYEGTTIGPNVAELDGKKLQWEAGSFDYFVMFKSLMGNDIREICTSASSPAGCDWEDNPEPDSCLPQSTFQLTNQHVPEDAYVEAAYLVWTSSLDPNNVNHTDNTATLNFTSDDGQITQTVNAVAPRIGTAGTDANPGQQDFTFEGITTESGGTIYGGYYTYRVDVTDFFNQIHAKGRDLGYKSDGMSLYGSYTVSDVECSNSSDYLSQIVGGNGYSASVMCGWSLITVYRSVRVEPKMVYIYNGFGRFCKQEVNLGISGFEFPDKPIIKMTMAVHEGDPGLASATGCGGLLGGGACPPEGLQVTGQTTAPEDLVVLQNQCNPGKGVDQSGTPFNYSDTYNSISSIYGWNDDLPTCIGGDPNNPDPNALEYTMDVDTFLLNAEKEPLFDTQFKKGDNSMFIKIGANQDCIYPNYMVVSLDTKAPRYDIPVNPATPDGREKNYCSCSEQADAVCATAPFYFAVKIQNWGDDISTNVTIQDTLSTKVNYAPGTTEMCKEWKSENVCKKWIPIEDVNGGFPLATPYKVADMLSYCDSVSMTCEETIMIRFKVKPKDNLAKNEVIENTAIINDDSGKPYKTNTSIPLRLTFGSCPSASACENPDLTNCGGYGDGEGCTKDEECGAGKVCKNGGCVTDDSLFAQSAKITVAKGKNSPLSESAIIVAAPAEKLVMGQFTIMATTEENGKNFSFDSLVASLYVKDQATNVGNIRLVYDKNGNGVFDEGDTEVTDPQSPKANSVALGLKNDSAVYETNVLHHFLIVADVSYKNPESIPVNTSFYFYIEDIDRFSFSKIENVTAEISESPMNFAEFSFEPTTEAFVFTKGSVEPPVPSPSNINKSSVGILQVRAKSIAHSNSIKKITLKTTSKSVKFNEGIKKIAVYLDVDKNASAENEMMLASATPGETSNVLDIVFDTPVSFEAGEEKTLLFTADFNIPKDLMAQIEIQKSKVKLETNSELIGLPIKSKEFSYKCEEGDLTCMSGDDDGGSCAVTAIDDKNTGIFALIAAILFVFGFAFFTRKSNAE